MSLHRIKLMKSRPNKPPKHIKAPGRIALIKEARTLVDIGSVAVSFAQRGAIRKSGEPAWQKLSTDHYVSRFRI